MARAMVGRDLQPLVRQRSAALAAGEAAPPALSVRGLVVHEGGAGLARGYHRRPEATREAEWFDASGKRFIRTGDVGRIDAAGDPNEAGCRQSGGEQRGALGAQFVNGWHVFSPLQQGRRGRWLPGRFRQIGNMRRHPQ